MRDHDFFFVSGKQISSVDRTGIKIPAFMFRFDKAGDPTQPLDLFIDDPLPSQ
jgi:hypothetical protein